ncbi:hypothetical protein ANANG_G00264460 [Anguilla anguilla]|uniref:Uncharacterized protein n=1 Tax=Anguilla anguilla TaxID=7936 RepID=A0A9D3LTZ2_ANGAN|nr:hypothetical protein ANANG_G00264460 [Anguilla anguilla]
MPTKGEPEVPMRLNTHPRIPSNRTRSRWPTGHTSVARSERLVREMSLRSQILPPPTPIPPCDHPREVLEFHLSSAIIQPEDLHTWYSQPFPHPGCSITTLPEGGAVSVQDSR